MNKLRENGKPVTIAIGILCDDSILMGSDSQTTRDNIKSMGATKVSMVKMLNAQVLVAQAGHVDHGSKVLQSLGRLSQERSLDDYQTFSGLMQDALFEVRSEIRRQQFNCSAEDLQDYFRKHETDCHLLAGHYFKGIPYIYYASLSGGVASKVAGGNGSEYYAAIGTGAALGLYLLEEFSKPKTGFNSAFGMLLYAIGEAKKHDTYCAGQTRFGFIGEDNQSTLMDQEIIDDASSMIESYNAHSRENRNRQITDMLESVAERWVKKYENIKPTSSDHDGLLE